MGCVFMQPANFLEVVRSCENRVCVSCGLGDCNL